jgi:pimeloyl-ACP methyl ester carboxylesterase
MGKKAILVLAAAPLMLASMCAAQTAPGPQTLTFHSAVDDSEQPYALYLPKSFRIDEKYPLVISLHSEQSNHRLNLRQVFGLPGRAGERDTDDLRLFPASDAGYIVACPLARGTMGYQGIAETDVYDVLADVERRFSINRDRIYLTGISMGGSGALRLALTRPGIWAAVAVVCPTATPGLEELAPNALDLPVRFYHGEQDPITPPAISRDWQRRLLDVHSPMEYVEYPAVRHNAWDFAYRGNGVFEWFGKFRRNPFPESVRLVTRSYRYSTAYWVQIDGLTPGTAASIDAHRTASEIRVQTSNVDGFTLSLDRTASAVTIDGAALRVKPAASLSFLKAAGQWREGRFAPTGKRPGLEGPIVEAVSGRHIYVYGTLGAAGDELDARRKIAETAAAWSSSRSRLGLSLAVKADTAVTDADLGSSDLILFGRRDSNSLIARLAPRMPLELNPGAADYGLLFIVPTGKHYALVNSGLPWWTGGEPEGGADAFAPAQYRALSTLGDYILFKGSLGNVISEGRFTRDWKVSAEASARMQSTGTVH